MGLCKKKTNKKCIPKEGMPLALACQKKGEQKKIKEAYPKKVCHMLWHVKKREKRQPLSKRKKERWFIHHPPKISTHLHILIKVYDLFLLWIRSLTQQKYEKQVCLQILHTYSSTKMAIRGRLRKKGTIKGLGKELYTLSDPRDHPRNFVNFF